MDAGMYQLIMVIVLVASVFFALIHRFYKNDWGLNAFLEVVAVPLALAYIWPVAILAGIAFIISGIIKLIAIIDSNISPN